MASIGAFPGLSRLANIGSRMAALQYKNPIQTTFLNPMPTPPGPAQGPGTEQDQPINAPNVPQGDLTLEPMQAGIEPQPVQPPGQPVLPSPPASSMIRDVAPRGNFASLISNNSNRKYRAAF